MTYPKKLIFIILLMAMTWNTGQLLAVEQQLAGGRDSPVILTPSNSNLRIDTVYAFPYPDTASVFIYFDADSLSSIRQFEFELSYPDSDLAYAGYSIASSAWQGDIVIDTIGANLEVQGFNDTLSADSNHALIELKFAIDDSVGFEHTMNLNFQPDVYFKRTGSEESYDPNMINGWITTYSDSFWVNIPGSVKGYSYQALDTSGSKETMFLNVPVYMYADFPCSEFKFWIKYRPNAGDSGLIFAGYDTTAAKYNAVASMDLIDSTLIRIDNADSSATFDSENSFTLLTLKFKVGDFHEEYNDTCIFDSLLALDFYDCEDDYLQGADSDFKYSPDTSNFSDGSVYLPVYKSWAVIGDGKIGSDSTVTLPVKMRPEFWAQYYKFYICYNHLEIELDTITATTTGTVPETIAYGFEDTSGSIYTIWVDVDTLLGTEYIPAGSSNFYSLFNLKFSLGDSLDIGDSTEVYFQTVSEICEVWDYFPPEYDTLHVKRYSTDCDGCFNDSSGYVYMPDAMVYGDDDVPCEENTAYVPVRVQWINDQKQNTEIRITAKTKGPLWYTGIIEDSTDFDISWEEPEIVDEGAGIIVTGNYEKYEIDDPGMLLKLAMAAEEPEPVTTPVILDEVRFGFDSFYWYAATEDGYVLPCDRGREGRIVIPTFTALPVLEQNSPNPFNAVTNIQFRVPDDGRVAVDIYDILGRRVRQLFSDHVTAGTHKIAWDCKNQDGDDVTSGFYIYILSTDNHRESKKMLMLK